MKAPRHLKEWERIETGRKNRKILEKTLEENRWFRFPYGILEGRIHPYAKLVYLYLWSRVNTRKWEGMCYPSIDTISKRMHVCRSSVVRALKTLKALKLIYWVQSGRKELKNYYVLLPIPEWLKSRFGAYTHTSEAHTGIVSHTVSNKKKVFDLHTSKAGGIPSGPPAWIFDPTED